MAERDSSNDTLDLLRIIGSPFGGRGEWSGGAGGQKDALYDLAFENRVELLFLQALEELEQLRGLEDKKAAMEQRAATTRRIAAETSGILTLAGIEHVVFKSIKPYSATPNDTDVLCLGDEAAYRRGLEALTRAHYVIQGSAPMQTLLYHPMGEGRVAVDFYEYVSRAALQPFCVTRQVDGLPAVLLAPEPELAIVMFHNVFPEKTFHLEHFYLCLYAWKNPEFRLERFVDFVEQQALTLAVRCNLTLVEALHLEAFGSVPEPVCLLLKRWGREQMTLQRLRRRQYRTTFIFPAAVFWRVFLAKQKDPFSRRSLRRQVAHMAHPAFFWDVVKSAWGRTFRSDHYVHQ
jgi:hypothetical protein